MADEDVDTTCSMTAHIMLFCPERGNGL